MKKELRDCQCQCLSMRRRVGSWGVNGQCLQLLSGRGESGGISQSRVVFFALNKDGLHRGGIDSSKQY